MSNSKNVDGRWINPRRSRTPTSLPVDDLPNSGWVNPRRSRPATTIPVYERYETVWFNPGLPLTTKTSASGGFAGGRDKRRYGELGEIKAADDGEKGRSQGSRASSSDGAAVDGGEGWSQGSGASTSDGAAVYWKKHRFQPSVKPEAATPIAMTSWTDESPGFISREDQHTQYREVIQRMKEALAKYEGRPDNVDNCSISDLSPVYSSDEDFNPSDYQ